MTVGLWRSSHYPLGVQRLPKMHLRIDQHTSTYNPLCTIHISMARKAFQEKEKQKEWRLMDWSRRLTKFADPDHYKLLSP